MCFDDLKEQFEDDPTDVEAIVDLIKNETKEKKAARNLDASIFDDPNDRPKRPMSASIFRRTSASGFSVGNTSEKVKIGKFAGKKIAVVRKGSSHS